MSQMPNGDNHSRIKNSINELKYKNNSQSKGYVNSVLNCGSFTCTMSGSERKTTNSATLAALPSEDAVDEMRNWSIECEL